MLITAIKMVDEYFDLEKKGILDNAGIEDDLMVVEQLLDQHL